MRKLALLALGVSVSALSAAPGLAADSCGGGCPTPPKHARAVSAEFVTLATYPGNTLSATLAKGKKKRILMADGMLTEPNPVLASREYALGISVNGVAMHPSVYGPGDDEVTEDCGIFRSDPDRKCTVTGHWWLDMDDPANAALIGVPITVTLVGGETFGSIGVVGNVGIDMSLRVRLEQK